jgi:hypothetical protein
VKYLNHDSRFVVSDLSSVALYSMLFNDIPLVAGRFHPFYRPRRPLGRVEV